MTEKIMAAHRVDVLPGGLSLFDESGHLLPIPSEGLLTAVLLVLAINAGRDVPQSRLRVAGYKPDDRTEQDMATPVSRIRTRYDLPIPVRNLVTDSYRLEWPPERVDALRFRDGARRALGQLRSGDLRGFLDHAVPLLGMWGTELPSTTYNAALNGMDLFGEIELLHRTLATECIKAMIDQGVYGKACELAADALRLHPDDTPLRALGSSAQELRAEEEERAMRQWITNHVVEREAPIHEDRNVPEANGEATDREEESYSDIAVEERLARSDPPGAANRNITVGMLIPDMYNDFFTELVAALQRSVEWLGWTLEVRSAEGQASREKEQAFKLLERGINAFVYIGTGCETAQEVLNALIEADIPTIVLDRIPESDFLDSVTVDSELGTKMAVAHLVEDYSHRKIGYLAGPVGVSTADERLQAFHLACKVHRLNVRSEWLFEGDFTQYSGYLCGEDYAALAINNRPTAVVAANDQMARGFMCAVVECGLSVPGDVSVVGFDGIADGDFTIPPLTTVAQPIPELVGAVTRRLSLRIGRPGRRPERTRIVPSLKIRKSVTTPRTSVR